MPNKNNNIANLTKEQQDALKAATDYMNLVCMDFEELAKRYTTDKAKMYTDLMDAFQKADDTLNKVRFIPGNQEYALFAEAVHRSDKLLTQNPTMNGLEVFRSLKKGYMNALHAMDAQPVKDSFNKEGIKKVKEYRLTGQDSIFDEIISLLNSGNATFRGSSAAYKEIEKDIKDLKKVMDKAGTRLSNDPNFRRYAMVMSKAVMEKAARYIDKRANVELKCSPDSYKGKRVRVMNQVFDRLKALSGNLQKNGFDEFDLVYTDLSEDYKKKISSKLLSGTFTKSLYAEYKAMGKGALGFVDKAYTKNMEDPDFDILADGIQDEKDYSIKKLNSWMGAVKKQMKSTRKLVEDAGYRGAEDMNRLREEVAKTSENVIKMEKEANDPLAFLKENQVTGRVEQYTGKVTGIQKLDQAIMNAKNEYLKANLAGLSDGIEADEEDEFIYDGNGALLQ